MSDTALVKMKIFGCSDPECTQVVKTFEVLFNPSAYNRKYEIEYDESQGAGTSGTAPAFGSIKPQDFSFDFYIDGTVYKEETTNEYGYVESKIKEFLDTVYSYDGEQHKPNYAMILWSSFCVKCILKTADISYSLFKSDGTPIRAKISANFSEYKPDEVRVAEEGTSSPDLTHIREFTAGESLPLMSYKIYKDPKYYFQVAEKNELNNFRRILQGTKLKYPPLGEESV